MASKQSEVSFGEAQEKRVLRRWMDAHGIAPDSVRVIGGRAFSDWDFLLLDSDGWPLCYVEVKVRRQSLRKFGDVMSPIRKHEKAVWLRDRLIQFLIVTEYPDALVQVDLADTPTSRRTVARKDRPGTKPVPHGFWSGAQLNVLEGDE